VVLDGRGLGTTPLTVTVAAGPHTLDLLSAGITKTVPVTITGGARVEQYIEMPAALPPEAPGTTGPDETPVAPVTSPAPGAAVPQPRRSAAASTASTTPLATAAAADGWLTLHTPIDVTVESGGRPLGSSVEGRLKLAAGAHELTLRNDSLGYRTTRRVNVRSGRETDVVVAVPSGLVAVNAQPWADVWVDGSRVGATPIGNLPLPIGTHDVVLRHPDYGEQRHAITVTTAGVARVSVDLRP
jgi:hypothetical protein